MINIKDVTNFISSTQKVRTRKDQTKAFPTEFFLEEKFSLV